MDFFSPELQLACACCRVQPTPADLAVIARLVPQVNAERFLDLVIRRHRIGPLVYAALRRCPDAASSPLLAPLAAEAQRNVRRVMRAVGTHTALARWFQEAAIPWLAFKGLTLAKRFYGDVGLRHANDLDFLVAEQDVEAARAVLARQGFKWQPVDTGWDLAQRGPHHQRYLAHYVYEEEHRSAAHGLLELHWRLSENSHAFQPEGAVLAARGERQLLGGAEVVTMEPTDLLLYLCDHGGRHGWYRLKWLADLPQLLEGHAWDWAQVLSRAEQAGCTRALLLGLRLAERLFGWQAPPLIAGLMTGNRLLHWQSQIAIQCLLAPYQWWQGAAGIPFTWRMRLVLYRFSLLPDGKAWAAQLWRWSLSPNDLRVVALPDRAFPIYYLLRPGLLVWRYLLAWCSRRAAAAH